MPDRHGPLRATRFLLEIDGLAIASFARCRLPTSTTEVIDYRNGNDPPRPRKLAGLHRSKPLILEKGVTQDSIALAEWRQQVTQGSVDSARRPIAVVLLDEEGEPGPRWEFEQAWPSKYTPPTLDALHGEVAIERLTIVTEGFERVA